MDILKEIQVIRSWNFAAFLVHIFATIAILGYLNEASAEKRRVQMTRLKFDETIDGNSRVDIPVKLQNNVNIDLKPLLVSFFAITALAHLFYAIDYRGIYSKNIAGVGWNPYRWIEYSLSAGVMIYIIAAVSGTKDQVSAVSAALITPGLMINGLTSEKELQQNAIADWSRGITTQKPKIDSLIILSNFVPAWGLYFVKWYIILSNYTKIVREAKAEGKSLDSSVTFMVYSQFAFFSLFGVIQSYQVYRWFFATPNNPEAYFISYEKAYIVLSAVTKLVLALTVAYALRN